MWYRALACSLALLGITAQGVAQRSDYPKSLWLGLRGGMHFSKYQFVPTVSQRQRLGKHAGLALRLELERGASAQLELNYTETGWVEKYEDANLHSERRLTYIELPFLTQLYLGKGAVRCFVNLGPFLGYALGEEHITRGEGFNDAQLVRQTMPLVHKIAWGLTGGPGLSLGFAKRHRVELELRASYNFQDIWANKRVDPYGQSTELRFGASLGYYFRF